MKVAVVGCQGVPAQYGGYETLVEYLVEYRPKDVEVTVYCSDQGADGKVAAIHQQSGGIHRPFPVNGGFQPGVAATLPSLRRRLGEEVRVEIVGEQDGRDVRLLGAAFGHGAGREHTQHRQQQRQKKCGKTAEFHRVPPSYSKKRVR